MKEDENEILIIQEDEEGVRLDKILANRFREIQSRTYFQYLIDEHLVLLNGFPVKKSVKPQSGDEIEVEFALTPEIDLKPEAIPLNILYEDEHLLVINKPVGMVVHPAPGNWTGTFVNALLYHCQHLSVNENDLRPGIVHRLDKDTSGVLIAAKTTWAQQKLVEAFASRQVYKEYLAICIGNIGDKEIDAPIGRHPVHRKEMAVVPTGKNALTICKTIGWNEKLSIVKIVIATGRTHQIRVHLKHSGVPVLGDNVYGIPQSNKFYGVEHQLLHASRIRLNHPATGKELDIVAPPPENMVKMLKKIDSNWKTKL
ncbi:MAG: RluA family pseudouridine synthase [Parachlamydiaceae bacterium]|nr:RluA family pseudouridine synthase [Parachlamydiaceae bacterium]